MSAPVVTLNCTVGEIEELLAKGVPVEQIARDLQEPRQNVVAVWDRWRKNNGAVATTPPAAPLRSVGGLPTPAPTAGHRIDEGRITVDALVNAAARSTSKRTQVLGVRLADLGKVVRDRLAEERTAAEKAEAEKAEREKARVEVERLETQLREARAKLRSPKRQGGGSPVRRKGSTGITPERRAAMLAGQRNSDPCTQGCGFVAKTKSGKSAHERHCDGGA